jgi:hypothetical protein
MQYRKWLLVAALGPIVYGFVLIRLEAFLKVIPTYGGSDIYAATVLAIALLASWTVLEVAAHMGMRNVAACSCGFSLRGVRCPECGRVQGEPVAGEAASA